MTDTISIKVTRIKPERRSRGRVATSTRTLVRGIRADAHPAQIMLMMSAYFPLLKVVPVAYQAQGVRYELLRMETRKVNGARRTRAVFKDERAVRKSFAREMRRRRRAARKAALRAARLEASIRMAQVRTLIVRALACAMIARAYAAQRRRAATQALAAKKPLLAQSSPCQTAPRQSPLAAAAAG